MPAIYSISPANRTICASLAGGNFVMSRLLIILATADACFIALKISAILSGGNFVVFKFPIIVATNLYISIVGGLFCTRSARKTLAVILVSSSSIILVTSIGSFICKKICASFSGVKVFGSK